jgi:hypothetical protein
MQDRAQARALTGAIGGGSLIGGASNAQPQGMQRPAGEPPVLDQPMPSTVPQDSTSVAPRVSAAPTAGAPDVSKWNTDGFWKPGYTAQNKGGFLKGWDETKWNDPNHQTPKYVIGGILGEAAGENRRLDDPAERAAAEAKILQAYPGSTFNGKDKITLPDGRVIDIYEGASSGDYIPSYQEIAGEGGVPHPTEQAEMPGGSGGFVSQNRGGGPMPWESGNTQPGGDALQAIYKLLGPLMADLTKDNALQNALKGSSK